MTASCFCYSETYWLRKKKNESLTHMTSWQGVKKKIRDILLTHQKKYKIKVYNLYLFPTKLPKNVLKVYAISSWWTSVDLSRLSMPSNFNKLKSNYATCNSKSSSFSWMCRVEMTWKNTQRWPWWIEIYTSCLFPPVFPYRNSYWMVNSPVSSASWQNCRGKTARSNLTKSWAQKPT